MKQEKQTLFNSTQIVAWQILEVISAHKERVFGCCCYLHCTFANWSYLLTDYSNAICGSGNGYRTVYKLIPICLQNRNYRTGDFLSLWV